MDECTGKHSFSTQKHLQPTACELKAQALCAWVQSMVRLGLLCALLASALLIGITSASQSFDPHEPSGEVVQLTDENFDKLTECELPWFIAVTAPWCALVMSCCWRGVHGHHQLLKPPLTLVTHTADPCNACRCTHCQDLEPIWREVAQRLKGEVHVGKASCKAAVLTVIRCAVLCLSRQGVRRWVEVATLTVHPCAMPAQIDSTSELVLQQRFGVEAYPSLYFLKAGETRECFETRTVAKVCETHTVPASHRHAYSRRFLALLRSRIDGTILALRPSLPVDIC
jgi:hypothetical protein